MSSLLDHDPGDNTRNRFLPGFGQYRRPAEVREGLYAAFRRRLTRKEPTLSRRIKPDQSINQSTNLFAKPSRTTARFIAFADHGRKGRKATTFFGTGNEVMPKDRQRCNYFSFRPWSHGTGIGRDVADAEVVGPRA